MGTGEHLSRELLYEGKAKIMHKTDDPGVLVMEFKDHVTAQDGKKRASLSGKGSANNKISGIFFTVLEQKGVPNHYLGILDDTRSLVRACRILQIEAVVRNIAAGSLCRRLGIPEGTELMHPVVEFYYKNDSLGDPLVNDDHIRLLRLATGAQLLRVRELSLRVNEILLEMLRPCDLKLVDFKLEFGQVGEVDDQLIVADEISPDTCRFWDTATADKLDKDRFRNDIGGVVEAYEEVLSRLQRIYGQARKADSGGVLN